MVLIDRARPERLGPLVRALAAEVPDLEVHVNALKLAGAAKQSTIVLIPDLDQAKWLNMERPILAERSLRVILFSDEATSAGLARSAPDFFHWISHWMECPAGPWRPAGLGIRAAAAAGAGIVWTGGDFGAAFEAALPGQARIRISAAGSYDALVDAIRAAGDGWIEVVDIDGLFRLRRVRWAMVEAERAGRIALIEPAVEAPGFWPAHGKPMAARDACRLLEEAGAPSAGRLAALLDLEPEAVELAAERLRAGVTQAELEAEPAASEDPGAEAARRCTAEGAAGAATSSPWRRAIGAADVAAGADEAEAAMHAGRWVDAGRKAWEVGDADVAARWAQDERARASDPARAAQVLGLALADRGELEASEAVLREAVAGHERASEQEPANHAALLRSLAFVLSKRGRLDEARALADRALHLRLAHGATEDDQGVAALLHLLGKVLFDQGDLAGARSRIERSLRIQTKLCGTEDHPQVAVLLHELAGVLLAQGDLTGARDTIERSLRIQATLYGTEDHPQVAASLHELARVLFAQGDLTGARDHLERSLRAQVRLHGTEDNPHVAASLHELARVLFAQGDLTGARDHLERSLRAQVRLHGTEDHPHVAASLHELAGVLRAQGDLAGARARLEDVLAVEERIYGTRNHPSTAQSEASLAVLLLGMGERARALELLRHAHQTFLDRLGPDHDETLKAAALIARLSPPEESQPPSS
ncbi:MAG: tetratricopeptide repeat protein [Polyangiaceae bacterium]|nr:tetratricopeptide repeat protein [Polyangiaceae bacterium]